jgi:hypothetical protein
METNNVSPEKKGSILNTLAVAGLVAIILLLAWLAIQLVQMMPNAFSSLASLAEGVNQASETTPARDEIDPIVVTANTSLVKTGETLEINWEKAKKKGSYVFRYDCIDGVAVNQIDEGVERQLECDTNYNVGDTTSLTISVESEKNRYTDVPYSISFLATNDTKPQAMGTDVVTVINENVNSFAFSTDSDELTNSEVVTQPEAPVVTETPAPTPQQPVYVQEFVYEIPTSDPNGFTDVGTSFIAVGEIKNNQFVPGVVQADKGGAIQFAVKNFGTKTSDKWSFTVTLPHGGTYKSPTQEPLKPNERAVLTIGFPEVDTTTHTFKVTIDEPTDRNSKNNSFTQRVTFSN